MKLFGIDIPKHILDKARGTEILSDRNKIINTIIRSEWLMAIPGIGPKHAVEMTTKGITSEAILLKYISELPTETQFYLKYRPKPIEYKNVEKIAQELMYKIPKNSWFLAGSYRRQKPVSGDIDIVVMTKTSTTAATSTATATSITFPETTNVTADKLKSPKWHVYAEGQSKISGIYESKMGVAHVDIYLTTFSNLAPMMLYATGSRQHNIIMRSIAKKAGFTLSQYGLYDIKTDKYIKIKIPRSVKTIEDAIISGEKFLFTTIGMTYKPPEKR